MQEFIGKVMLDDSWYAGKDVYSDGDIEERLLQIAKEYGPKELNAVIARERDWAVLYHMSRIRENIVSWMPFTKEDSVLEVGAGCGAVTGALAQKAGKVTCVELSRRRSRINALRHRDCGNVQILVGNFQDIEKNLPEKYDYITLIGVFEYAKGYIQAESPYEEFLRRTARHLKPGGRLVIAIENRLGLKYWAGCREDHTGHYFEGLENYDSLTPVRTFSKPELERLFANAGFTRYRFYYPYPDYKFPMAIYSDEYLPRRGELNGDRENNYDRERLGLFNESRVFDSLLEDGLFPLYSNSYLVILEETQEQ